MAIFKATTISYVSTQITKVLALAYMWLFILITLSNGKLYESPLKIIKL